MQPLATRFAETAAWLTNANAKRNELVDRLRRLPDSTSVAQLYFGAPSATGAATSEYPEAVAAVSSHTDELIFFSAALANDLAAHGQRLRTDWIGEFGRGNVPGITAVDFTAARQDGLMPDDAKFAEWLASLDRQIVGDQRP